MAVGEEGVEGFAFGEGTPVGGGDGVAVAVEEEEGVIDAGDTGEAEGNFGCVGGDFLEDKKVGVGFVGDDTGGDLEGVEGVGGGEVVVGFALFIGEGVAGIDAEAVVEGGAELGGLAGGELFADGDKQWLVAHGDVGDDFAFTGSEGVLLDEAFSLHRDDL